MWRSASGGGPRVADLRTLRRRAGRLIGEIGGHPRAHHAPFSGSDRLDGALASEAASAGVQRFGPADIFEGLKRQWERTYSPGQNPPAGAGQRTSLAISA